MRVRGRWVVKGVLMVVLAGLVFVAVGWIVMSLWNVLVPTLFHGPQLVFWQAVGLLLLSRLLFGGLRGGRGWHGHWRGRMWRERWASMTPEERAQLRERFAERCGRHMRHAHDAPPPG